MFLLEINSSLY